MEARVVAIRRLAQCGPDMETDMEPTVTITHPETPGAIERCYPVMAQLRPHLTAEAFVEQAQRQMSDGYALLFAEVNGTVAGVAGYRILENLAYGRFLYVDDLVTDEAWRSKGSEARCSTSWWNGARKRLPRIPSGLRRAALRRPPFLPREAHGHHEPPFRDEAGS